MGAGTEGRTLAAAEVFAAALQHHQAGRLREAEQFYRRVLSADPRHGESWRLLGLLAYQAQDHGAAATRIGRAIAIDGGRAQWHFDLALARAAQNRMQEAQASCRRALALHPCFTDAHVLLADILWQGGALEEAESAYRRALKADPGSADAWAGLGNVRKDRGAPQEAAAHYRRALEIAPGLAVVHNNLGNACRDLGDLDGAADAYRQALALWPDLAEAQNNLAATLWDAGAVEEAQEILLHVLQARPDYLTARNNLAALLLQQGDAAAAMEHLWRSLSVRETPKARRLFVEIARRAHWTRPAPAMAALMARALGESWGRSSELARAAGELIRLDPRLAPLVARAQAAWPRTLSAAALFGDGAALSGHGLLETYLGMAQNHDIALEHFFTLARRALLESADTPPDGLLPFHAALARQCFLNEYVFAQDDRETACAARVREEVGAALARGEIVPPHRLMALACYAPLHSLAQAGRLLKQAWPDAVMAVLAQQLREPQAERDLRAVIPRLTAIADTVSQTVRQHYEENPYPRWVGAPIGEVHPGVAASLARKFPLAAFQRGGRMGEDILIAGCGTGQQSVETARNFPQSRVLAVDLSLASLAYAERKRRELGLDNLQHAQADILELDGTRRFDVIEAAGVLHHMADPFAAWSRLVHLLRPGGLMLVGLYSATARQGLARLRARIAREGHAATPAGIRHCRQRLLADRDDADSAAVAALADFHGVSTCRDLLFHGQERHMTLPQIGAFLGANNLTFIGFETGREALQAYRQRHPGDPAATDLARWHAFEQEQPQTFAGMYQFWVQKTVLLLLWLSGLLAGPELETASLLAMAI